MNNRNRLTDVDLGGWGAKVDRVVRRLYYAEL